METDRQCEAAVQEARHGFPPELHKANLPEVSSVSLWDHNHCLSHALGSKGPLVELCLHDVHHLVTIIVVWCFLPNRLPKPLAEVVMSSISLSLLSS